MTDIAATRPGLGVGPIIGESVRIWLANLWPIYLASFVPQFVMTAIIVALFGIDPILGLSDFNMDRALLAFANVLDTVLAMVAGAISTAVVVRIAYDAASDRETRLGAAFSGAVPHILPLAVTSFAMTLASGFAAILLIVPGLYLYAKWSLYAPAIIVEKCGFRGLGRSAALTDGYRWPLVGLILIALVGLLLFGAAINVTTEFVRAVAGGYVAVIVPIVIGAVIYGPLATVNVMIYARLREIKEGVVVQDLAAVFD